MAKLIVAGDLFPTKANIEYFISADIENIFGNKIIEVFKGADYRVCNLEGSLCDETVAPIKKDGPKVRAAKETIRGISELGINCVSLANNHTTDYGLQGYDQTCETLYKNCIDFFGSGRDIELIKTHHRVTIGGKNIILYGVSETIFNIPGDNTPGANLYDEYRVCKELDELRKKCDYLIVLYHGGMEYYEYPTKSIMTRFHRMADSGADAILAQHTHCIGVEEYYNNTYCLYGQGNFCFNLSSTVNKMNLYGLVLEFDVLEDEVQIVKHLVKRTSIGTSYDVDQDLEELISRSKRISNGENVEEEFNNYADDKVTQFLQAFRGKDYFGRLIRKVFGEKHYKKYIMNKYSRTQLLKILNALRADEFNELTIRGIENLINRKN